jgi:hypothetical protein
LLQIDDVDTRTVGKDVSFHLRVPASGLVSEVNAAI